jgi:hypothetical protein
MDSPSFSWGPALLSKYIINKNYGFSPYFDIMSQYAANKEAMV